MTLDFMKSGVIAPSMHPPKLKSFCWNIWFYKVLGGFHMKSARFHEIRWISWMWAFAWWSSIGLSFERPIKTRKKRRENPCSESGPSLSWMKNAVLPMQWSCTQTQMYTTYELGKKVQRKRIRLQNSYILCHRIHENIQCRTNVKPRGFGRN